MHHLDTEDAQRVVVLALYDRCAAAILAFLAQRLSNRQDAEDVLLEVFLAALTSKTLAQLSEEQQLAWLHQVARNKLIDRYRHAAVVTFAPLEDYTEIEDGALTPEQHVLQREQYEQLRRALRHLSERQQQLLQWRYGAGLRLVEIAGLLHQPEGTVRKWLLRTLRQARALYEQEGQEL